VVATERLANVARPIASVVHFPPFEKCASAEEANVGNEQPESTQEDDLRSGQDPTSRKPGEAEVSDEELGRVTGSGPGGHPTTGLFHA